MSRDATTASMKTAGIVGHWNQYVAGIFKKGYTTPKWDGRRIRGLRSLSPKLFSRGIVGEIGEHGFRIWRAA
jgi:hypothetical protein